MSLLSPKGAEGSPEFDEGRASQPYGRYRDGMSVASHVTLTTLDDYYTAAAEGAFEAEGWPPSGLELRCFRQHCLRPTDGMILACSCEEVDCGSDATC
jgi:hypothetical protein